MDGSPFYKEWSNQTVLNPLGLMTLLVMGVVLVYVQRRYAVLPMLVLGCLVAPAQRIVVLGLDFDLLRLMVLLGWIRILLRKEHSPFTWKPLDTCLVSWTLLGLITTAFLYGNVNAFVSRLGTCFDILGMYFLFRMLIRGWEDVRTVAVGAALMSVPILIAFLIEHSTRRNLFAFLGGVPAITTERGGRLRCQGAFAHPILAGCFWASLLPLIVAQWWQGARAASGAVIGTACSCAIIILCASSTPVAAVVFGIVAAACFPLRRWMRSVRWMVVFALAALHLIMKAPVWHLISRIDLVGGSTGWHRFNLIDQAINRVGEWGLYGSTIGTAHWGYGLEDVTNFYVVQGLHGGLPLLAMFVLMIGVAFAGVGRMWREQRDRAALIGAWALGVSLFIHATSFLAIAYFGQIIMVWYLTLAMIGSLTPARSAVVARDRQPRRRKVTPTGRPTSTPAAAAVRGTLVRGH